jgi:hypothetical protein
VEGRKDLLDEKKSQVQGKEESGWREARNKFAGRKNKVVGK